MYVTFLTFICPPYLSGFRKNKWALENRIAVLLFFHCAKRIPTKWLLLRCSRKSLYCKIKMHRIAYFSTKCMQFLFGAGVNWLQCCKVIIRTNKYKNYRFLMPVQVNKYLLWLVTLACFRRIGIKFEFTVMFIFISYFKFRRMTWETVSASWRNYVDYNCLTSKQYTTF